MKHVLVIDDERALLEVMRASLTLAGYRVTTTDNGEEALELVVSHQPDIVLLDILMVPMDGFEVLDRLRTISQVPVIVFTAMSSIWTEAMKIGATDCLAKPFRHEDLVDKIEKILGELQPGGPIWDG